MKNLSKIIDNHERGIREWYDENGRLSLWMTAEALLTHHLPCEPPCEPPFGHYPDVDGKAVEPVIYPIFRAQKRKIQAGDVITSKFEGGMLGALNGQVFVVIKIWCSKTTGLALCNLANQTTGREIGLVELKHLERHDV